MKMHVLLFSFLLAFLMPFLSGCSSSEKIVALSSAGTIGPALKNSLPKDARILVVSTLQPASVDIISENIFSYRKLGGFILTTSRLNPPLSQTMKAVLQKHGYSAVNTEILNSSNPLNTANIQYSSSQLSGSADRRPSHGSLTPEAKQFLAALMKNHPADFIVLLTQTGAEPLAFDLKCELSKYNTYPHASIEPHLYLYKIYIIDAHRLQPLAWTTGSFSNSDFRETHFCKPIEQFKTAQLKNLSYIITNGLNKAVEMDLSTLLKPGA